MCGILAILGISGLTDTVRKHAIRLSRMFLRHRGPDWSGVEMWPANNKCSNVFCHERLAIVDVTSGEQPLFNEDKRIVLVVNGEIYNHQELEKKHLKQKSHQFRTKSDCECLVHLYEEHGIDMINMLRGDFAFVLADRKQKRYIAARDPIGVFPLYWGRNETDGSMWFASEVKALIGDCDEVYVFPPGHYYDSKTVQFHRYYNPVWLNIQHFPTKQCNLKLLRQVFETAVAKRMMSDVPYGVLLSGGLDSSLVASCVVRHAQSRIETGGKEKAWWPQVHTFSIGLCESPDLKAAREVAKFLDTIHHEFTFTVQQGIDALEPLIWNLESYDVTTIRASTPMYLMARRIKALGVKMVLSGEGSDEIFAGYLYFIHAKDGRQLHHETVNRINNLHLSDCLRANKSTAAWGVETRVPFLDRDFLDVAMGFDPSEKMFDGKHKCEKHVLRKAFDMKGTSIKPYLPDSILWRQKEQFSDGVGYSWVDGLRNYADKIIRDDELKNAAKTYPINTPTSKEAYLYRRIFSKHFPSNVDPLVSKWQPTWGESKDPSGRVQVSHVRYEHFE